MVEREHPTPPRTRAPRDTARPITAPEGEPGPWVAEAGDPFFEQAVAGGAIAGAAPVLAYVDVARRSPAADRLIQTEVLLPDGPAARLGAFAKLLVALVAFGLVLGFGILGGVRGIGWLVSRLAG